MSNASFVIHISIQKGNHLICNINVSEDMHIMVWMEDNMNTQNSIIKYISCSTILLSLGCLLIMQYYLYVLRQQSIQIFSETHKTSYLKFVNKCLVSISSYSIKYFLSLSIETICT